jgi:hypothetical protein
MGRADVRYLSGAAAGACLVAIVAWVVDQLRRDSSVSGDGRGDRAAGSAVSGRRRLTGGDA